VAFALEDFLSSVRKALEDNMKDLGSPLLLDKDFSVEIAIYVGDYDKESKIFVKSPDVNYVGMWPIFHRED